VHVRTRVRSVAEDPGRVAPGQLAAIGRLHEQLVRQGVEYWLFGGWAVDFHVGRITRPHADIDVAIWRRDLEQVDQLLRHDGWTRVPQPGEDGYTVYRSGPHRLDLAFLARDDDGVVFTPLEEGRGTWSDGAFGRDQMELDGTRARVVTAASLLADKSERRDDPSAARKDRADVAALGGAPGED
jgi:hypothetical protein